MSHMRCECCAYSYKESEFTYPIPKWYFPISMSFCVITQISELSWSLCQRKGWDPSSGKSAFCSQKMTKLVLGLTQPPIRWVPGAFLLGLQHLECEADNWYLVLRLRIGNIMPLVPLCSSMACVLKMVPVPIFVSNWHSWK